ncbi:MAG: ACP S-malonyltransferase [Treponema sp.]|nr:ACP S-malonyltransferase [Treponema sp.]
MKSVFLFPGQGAQKNGMLKDVCEKYPEAMALVKKAEEISGEKISDFMWNCEESELARSDRSQLAITTASLAIAKVMETKGIVPEMCAGFSLGEFAALCTAGVLTFEETIKLVKERGIIMQKACDKLAQASGGDDAKPGMAAVLGLTPDQVKEAVKPLSEKGIAFAANMNSPKQTVISGTFEGIKEAEALCTAAGCRRFIKLKVAGPFHSPLMQEAGEEFEKVLETMNFKNPTKRLFSNVAGKEITQGEEAKKLAVKHFTNPVLWTSEEKEIAQIIDSANPDCKNNWAIYETGPGAVLSGLWRDSTYAENISCTAVNTAETLDSIN